MIAEKYTPINFILTEISSYPLRYGPFMCKVAL